MSALQANLPSIVEGDGGRKSSSVWIETSDPQDWISYSNPKNDH